ncbi:hypothetical protein MTO96_023732 [Rhipicephalus appendiculatus]
MVLCSALSIPKKRAKVDAHATHVMPRSLSCAFRRQKQSSTKRDQDITDFKRHEAESLDFSLVEIMGA